RRSNEDDWDEFLCSPCCSSLDYPHTSTGVKSKVIHRDVKSSNVLLDDKLTAKKFDFGVSRIGQANQLGNTNGYTGLIRGTFGYVDAKPALNLTLDEQQHSLARWAKHCIKEGKISRIIDPCLRGQVSANCLKESRKIAYECLLTSLKDRPTMTNVLSRLKLVLAWTLRSPQSANDQKGNGITTLLKRHDRDKVKLKSSSWKEVIHFGKRGKLNSRYIRPFKMLTKAGTVAYKLQLPQQLSKVHSTFHVSNLKKCLSDESLVIPLDEIQIDNKLHFVDEPVEILDREFCKDAAATHSVPVAATRDSGRLLPDTIQLETAVTTISHEYLLEFTSEYGISEALHQNCPVQRIGSWFSSKASPHPESISRILYTIRQLKVDVFQQEAGEKYPSMLNQFVRFPKKLEQPLLLGRQEGILNYCGLAHKCSEGWDASREYLFPGGCDDTEHTSHPNPKTTRSTTLLSRVEPQILPGRRDMDLFSLICAPNPTKVKTGTRLCAAHKVSLLTVTASRVIQMEDPATGTDSSSVPSTIERSSLDFANENPSQQSTGPEDQGQEAVAPDVPPPRMKSLAVIELGMGFTHPVPTSQGAPMDVNDPDLLSFTDPQSRPSADVTQFSNEVATARDPKSENTSFTSMVASPKSFIDQNWAGENEIKNLETLLEAESDMKKAIEGRSIELSKELENMWALFLDLQVSNNHLSQQVSTLQVQVMGEENLKAAFEEFKQYKDNQVEQRCAEIDARLDALSIDFDEELYLHMLTVITGRRWEIEHRLRLAVMKCGESTKLRQAFADIVLVGIAKGMSEGRKNRVKHGKANLSLEAIEAYNPEAEAKYITALHALKDLKYPILDQLGSLKDAPMDVIMAFLHLKSDTGDDDPQWIREHHPRSSQLSILVYPKARDPTDP
nr:serine/threonine/dual specificity protein kinase, catalytic domain-containing protein [Tanacetum cinerariifolium]